MARAPSALKAELGSHETLGQRIRALRQYAGMTQAKLATVLGLSRSAIAHWETDRDGRVRQYLPRLAELFEVPLEVFLNGMATQEAVVELTIDEVDLLRLYRSLDVGERLSVQRSIMRLLRRRQKAAP
ncbi:transcriptional regulator [Acetobacter estunensis NRIC 0472]|uniref:Helix-turn-helix domain-containing protein n=1 Tax=Acetobacter estunensis TaxID=104097 RepID=A0A967EIB2_9PROT|nr:helix-turn-helix transcriptional regulator [Acetobacter estunensis]MBV1837021.1 helix-turn-helix domain-containing protein [Acetobacter estunensis]NHO52914.1 helix-turn-helix domain-containing protein [Acetobacter estunensis]GBQ23347.1 transcriptional regulator [Acetobacter estunensis NRIC 0472]